MTMPIEKERIAEVLATKYGEAAYSVIEKLMDAGHEAWWVGGCVREMLMGATPHDIDVATSALPEQIATIFTAVDMSHVTLGSVRVKIKTCTFEVTTYREDNTVSDGRHPQSIHYSDREHDAGRRDITINAMYYNPLTRELYDPFGGEADTKERLIRYIGNPQERIEHDALRMLRAIRLRALIDGQYHPQTYEAIRQLARNVQKLSGMRQLQELEKMLMTPRPQRALEDMWETGLLHHFIPELAACKGVAQPSKYHHEGDVWDHTLQCVTFFSQEHGADVRLAAIFHDCGKVETFALKERIRFDHHATVSADIATKVLTRLQCTKKRREKINWLIKHHMMMESFKEMNDARKSHWYFHPWFPELLQLFWLDIAGTTPSNFALYESIVRDCNQFLDMHPRPLKRLMTGEQIMDILHIEPGEKVGEMLKALHEAQIRKEVTTRQEAKAFLQTFIENRTMMS